MSISARATAGAESRTAPQTIAALDPTAIPGLAVTGGSLDVLRLSRSTHRGPVITPTALGRSGLPRFGSVHGQLLQLTHWRDQNDRRCGKPDSSLVTTWLDEAGIVGSTPHPV